jgi:hypothetical protein
LVEFRRRPEGECVTLLHRSDGVVLQLTSYSRKHRVPHDMAHAVTERELGLRTGVFGLIAAGAMFKSVTIVAGKPRHDAATRSDRLMKAYGGSITTAEVLAGAVHDTVENGRSGSAYRWAVRSWGIVEQGSVPSRSLRDVDRAVQSCAAWLGVGKVPLGVALPSVA